MLPLSRLLLCVCALLACVLACSNALALDDVNPGGGYVGPGDWTGTAGNDRYVNNAAGTIAGSIDMTQGGSDTVINRGTVDDDIIGGKIGGNLFTNTGTGLVAGDVYGSVVESVNHAARGNTVVNSGEISGMIVGGVVEATGTGSSAGGNVIRNTTSGSVQSIYGDIGNAALTTGGNNRILNSGAAFYIAGSNNSGDRSSGDSNTVLNSGYSIFIIGSLNSGLFSRGGNNAIDNYGTVIGYAVGSYNDALRSTGGGNTLMNSGYTVYLFGSLNDGGRTSGGSNTLGNSGIIYEGMFGTINTGDNSTGGGNTITNSGSAGYFLIGAMNDASGTSGGGNHIQNSGTVGGPLPGSLGSSDFRGTLIGSANLFDNSSGGSNTIVNSGDVLSGTDNYMNFASGIVGSYNEASVASGGNNVIRNTATGYVEENVVGSYNLAGGTQGSGNIVRNAGHVGGSVYGSRNQGANSSGGDNTVTNAGTVQGSVWGSRNMGDNSSGGENTVTNSGTVNGSVYGSDNIGSNSSSGSNRVINSGTVTGSIYGSRDQGAGSSSSDNTVTNSGSVGGSILAGQNNDTVTIQGGSDVTGFIDGQAGTDALIFQDMPRIAGGQYRNFETMHLQSGSSKLTGTLHIANASTVDGSLSVNGVLNSPTVGIGQRGMLGGAGFINGNVINNGTIAPGNSMGTLTVNGEVTFTPGSRFEVELGIDGSSDLLYGTGAIDIQGGTLDVELERGLYTNAFSWRVMHADIGLSGRFDSVTTNSPLLTITGEVSGFDLLLSVQRRSYADFALTPPQQAVAMGLNALLPTASGDMAELLLAMDFDFNVAGIRQTLGQLSPEIYFGFKDTALRTAGLVRGIQEDRAAFLRAGKHHDAGSGDLAAWQGLSAGDVVGRGTWSLWARGLGAWSTRGARDGYLGYSADTQGLMAGVDGQLLPWLSLGAHLAYTSSAVDWSSGTAKGNQYGKHAGILASAEYADFYADAAFNFGWLENRATRPIVLPNQSTRAQADFDILTCQSSLKLGYDLVLDSWSFGPMASLTHLALHQERIRETEAGFMNLRLDNLRYSRTSTFIGGRVAGSLDLGGVILQPHLRLGWQHHLDQDRARLTAIFQDYPGAPMPLNEVKPGSDALIAKAGFTLLAGDHFTAGLDYALEHGLDGSSHSVGLELGLRF